MQSKNIFLKILYPSSKLLFYFFVLFLFLGVWKLKKVKEKLKNKGRELRQKSDKLE